MCALLVLEAGANIYAAVGMFKRRVSGWWVALVAEVASTAFSVMMVVRSPARAWSGLIMPTAHLLFLFWLRRYFPHKGCVGNGSASRR